MMQLLGFIAICNSLLVINAFIAAPRVRNVLTSLRMNSYDYDLIIIGCGVGGHGAALHARSNGLKTAVLTGKDVGGTCVNRGCVPSKALLAAAGRVREMKDAHHLKSFGITLGEVNFDRQGVANHASQLANKVKVNLEASLKGAGCDVIDSKGGLTDKPNSVLVAETGKVLISHNTRVAMHCYKISMSLSNKSDAEITS